MNEFIIEEAEFKDGHWIVSGIVNEGSVCIGDVFCDYFEVRDFEKKSTPLPSSICVTSIHAYGHKIENLPRGMSGEIWAVGDPLHKFVKHMILRGLSSEM